VSAETHFSAALDGDNACDVVVMKCQARVCHIRKNNRNGSRFDRPADPSKLIGTGFRDCGHPHDKPT
jgi:hypothetical protein